jgi:hypothetical protein
MALEVVYRCTHRYPVGRVVYTPVCLHRVVVLGPDVAVGHAGRRSEEGDGLVRSVHQRQAGLADRFEPRWSW